MRKTIVTVGVLLLLALAGYLSWYQFNRQEKIAHNSACDQKLTQQPRVIVGPGGEPATLQELCAYEVVPPPITDLVHGRMVFQGVPARMQVHSYSLVDVLLGRYTFGPVDVRCDQSATTTDCASLIN